MHCQSKRNTKKRPNDKGPTAATRGLDVVTVPRLSHQVEGKCQKYLRSRPFTLVPLNQEPPAALQHGFGVQGPCGRARPFLYRQKKIQNWKVLHKWFLEGSSSPKCKSHNSELVQGRWHLSAIEMVIDSTRFPESDASLREY